MSQAKDKRQQIEAACTRRRIAELYTDPIEGQYNLDHLKAINHHLFQDLPKHGFTDVTPGELRNPTLQHKDWIKQRELESINDTSVVAYSSMDNNAVSSLKTTLKGANPDILKNLKTEEFTKALGELYVACDYVHPFPDGNSRTLRELTRQLAKDSGYRLDWCVFDKSKAGRDTLYIARDLSVNELALKNVKNADTKREIAFALDKYDGNKKLPELLRDCVRPERSISFEKMEEREALKKHPELHHAYSVMHKAEAQFSTTKHGIREKTLSLIKGRLIDNLDQGETKAFQMNPGVTEPTKVEGIDKPSNREVDLDR